MFFLSKYKSNYHVILRKGIKTHIIYEAINMNIPGAVIFVNNDIDGYITQKLETQLFISETMTGDEFDARVAADPNYPNIIRLMSRRILVIRDDFRDYSNRDAADIALFISHGLASVLQNNYGPPGLTLSLEQIYIYKLLRYNNLIT